MKFNKYLFISLFALLGLTSSCVDDYFDVDPEVGEGEADVTAKVVFSPVLNALGENTRAAGDALKHINSLLVVVYDKDNKFVEKHLVWNNSQSQGNYGCTVENNNNATDVPPAAETKTPVANFTIPGMQFGKYHIYAVANMGDLSDPEYTQYNLFDKGVSTPEDLKSIRLMWQEDNIPGNDQMFGYFTTTDNQTSNGFDAPQILVNQSYMKLHAWVKRAASKVTVAIDGSGLNPGVQVWIKSIQIKDIPRDCWLGKNNVASNHSLIENGEKFDVSNADGQSGPSVDKENPYYYYGMSATGVTSLDGAHLETSPALYFYENMQGVGQSKKQIWEAGQKEPQFPNGNDPNDHGFKDNMRNGSYVEVIGYYKGKKNGSDTEGAIIYRFMLGKDTDKNYDAQRNYHYKLTLMLKGNANDTDWHIVYDQEPDIIIRNPYYISYLYDETMNLPIKIVGGELISLKAEIPNNEVNKNSWHAWNVQNNEKPYPYWNEGTPDNPGPWNGFLSLKKTKTARFGMINDDSNKFGSFGTETYTYNETYWYANSRGERSYDVSVGTHGSEEDGFYTVKKNGSEWIVSVPLYTRAAVMVEQTGYTGNNPYVAYRRMANVRFTAVVKDKNGEEHTVTTGPEGKKEDVTIYQMRRIVNPKGIWRSGNNTNPFHVKMMILPYETATEFEPLVSDGPWLAVVEKGKDWVRIKETPGVSQKNPDGTISGVGDPYDDKNPGSIIDFTYEPAGTTSTPRGGIIKIYYNNYTCVHKIFVRQGYDPVAFYNSTTKWHTFNLKTKTEEVSDPVFEGSYFRRYNWDYPIDASNNTDESFGVQADGQIKWKNGADRDFKIAGTNETRKWNNITSSASNWGKALTINGKSCRIFGLADFENLKNNENTIYGYGVLFTDNTTETPTSVSDVYGAREGSSSSGKGMRGVFVCDSLSGTQIFFPIGATGYGRFKQKANGVYNRQANGYAGVNQYANRYERMPLTGSSVYNKDKNQTRGVNYKPLFWDLYRRPGALYWMSWGPTSSGEYITGNGANGSVSGGSVLDINYFNFNFAWASPIDLGIVWNSSPDPSGSDAIQIRLVEDVVVNEGN